MRYKRYSYYDIKNMLSKGSRLSLVSAYAASYNDIPVIQVMKDVQVYYNYYLM